MADLEEIKRLLSYDPLSGHFTWMVRAGGNGCVKPGTRAGGYRGSFGYRSIKIECEYYKEHRLAYELTHGPIPKGMVIDHINGVPDDNRISNLRLATHQQNIASGRHRKNNTSGKKGVHRHYDGRWRARIMVNGKHIHLGCFATVDEAHEAYLIAAKKYFGEFARAA